MARSDDSQSSADVHVEVRHSPEQERYEAVVDGTYVGYLDYVDEPDRVVITHTVIGQRFEHRGYASALVSYVLDDLRSHGREVVPVCSYVSYFIDKHPEYSDVLLKS